MNARFMLLVLAAMMLIGCGRKGPTAEDTAPFTAAAEAYLKEQGMGMKVVEFKTLNVDDDTAVAAVALRDAEGLYKMNVEWEFSFQKQDDRWKTSSHRVR